VAFALGRGSTFMLGSAIVSPSVRSMIRMLRVGLMENLRLLPLMTLTRNSSEKQTSGEQVKSFHLRRV